MGLVIVWDAIPVGGEGGGEVTTIMAETPSPAPIQTSLEVNKDTKITNFPWIGWLQEVYNYLHSDVGVTTVQTIRDSAGVTRTLTIRNGRIVSVS